MRSTRIDPGLLGVITPVVRKVFGHGLPANWAGEPAIHYLGCLSHFMHVIEDQITFFDELRNSPAIN